MKSAFKPSILFDSPIVQVTDIRWHPEDGNPTVEFRSPRPEITFQRQGMFLKHQGRRRVACDPATLVLFNEGETYRMAHPVRQPCACTALLIGSQILADIVEQTNAWRFDRLESVLRFDSCLCEPDVAALHCALFAEAGRPQPEALVVEELAVTIARRVVESTQRFHSQRRPRARRERTRRAHEDIVLAVRQLLAARFHEALSLDDIARHAHCAPNHLCGVFKQRTGMTIHRYLVRLRLAAALDRLADGPVSLARLARDLGFASHAHFTTAFRREFRLQPSTLSRGRNGNAANT